jgi:UDP-glucose 4-epimerase
MFSSNKEKKCLVIGGGGYIGSYLVAILSSTGRKVTVIGRKLVPEYKLPVEVEYVQGNFSDLYFIQKLLDTHQEVIHLAYATVPNTSYDAPLTDLLENLPPTVQLFEEAAKRGNRLLFISSGGTVYGEAVTLPITEEHLTRPISPYGVTKLTLERYAYLYAATHGLNVICIRPGNAYGEGQRAFMGQGLIATAIGSALLGRPLTVFGEYGGIRDYIYVSDLANGIVAALERGKLGITYNLGSGVGLSTMDIIRLLNHSLLKHEYNIDVIQQPSRPFDVGVNVLDSTLLRDHTDWVPHVDFEKGISLVLECQLANLTGK